MRYAAILPDDSSRRENHVRMFEYALKYHNLTCEKYSAPEEMITFRVESPNGIKEIIIGR